MPYTPPRPGGLDEDEEEINILSPAAVMASLSVAGVSVFGIDESHGMGIDDRWDYLKDDD